ncbi:hypothetical protein [Streptomyces gibsoniae]|uniref:Methyltransferase MycE N-terminal domain-containing protein n=1 Tax=Streptomyces gibsoniae TaxID=3075529 RepID=A0ABU2U8W4_9ACTN|nr:hypothetical protein [Streptomyces sp. DSM 41699]MDT0469671.1 hypothetical protein [Streptomyces sp. DSM 41699]
MTTVMERVGRQQSAEASTEVIRRLLAATSTPDNDVAATIDHLGAEQTAHVLLDEIVFRSRFEEVTSLPDGRASLVLRLVHRERGLTATISVGAKGTYVHDGSTEGTAPDGELQPPIVSQEMSEVAQALYGPRELVSAATRTIQWPGREIVARSLRRLPPPPLYYAVAQRVVRVLDRREPADLTELAVRCGTDKWGALHQYPQHYERHFAPLRDRRLTILEIGIGGYDDPEKGGASLRMWKQFFPRALIYGIDIVDKRPLDAPRLTTVTADQSKPEQLIAFAERHGPFDIVIDDGSHISQDVITTFRHLFPYVRPTGGLYVIEDLHTAYWPGVFHGNDTDLSDPNYTVGFLKTLIDGLHHEEFLSSDAREPLATDTQIKGMHLYRNIAVIEKGSNIEGSPVAHMLREARTSGQ